MKNKTCIFLAMSVCLTISLFGSTILANDDNDYTNYGPRRSKLLNYVDIYNPNEANSVRNNINFPNNTNIKLGLNIVRLNSGKTGLIYKHSESNEELLLDFIYDEIIVSDWSRYGNRLMAITKKDNKYQAWEYRAGILVKISDNNYDSMKFYSKPTGDDEPKKIAIYAKRNSKVSVFSFGTPEFRSKEYNCSEVDEFNIETSEYKYNNGYNLYYSDKFILSGRYPSCLTVPEFAKYAIQKDIKYGNLSLVNKTEEYDTYLLRNLDKIEQYKSGFMIARGRKKGYYDPKVHKIYVVNSNNEITDRKSSIEPVICKYNSECKFSDLAPFLILPPFFLIMQQMGCNYEKCNY